MRNSRNRDERAAGGLPPHSSIFKRGILLFLLYVPSCPVLSTSRSRRTGRSRGFLFSQGVVGKSRSISGRKGVTDTLSARSGNSFRARKPAGYFLFLMVYGVAHPPRSRNYAYRIESSGNGGRSPRDELVCQ